MNRFLLLTGLIIASTLSFSTPSPAQSASAAAGRELVLEIPMLTGKNYDEIKNTLSHFSGVTLVGYCETYKFFLITYDPSLVKSGEIIAEQLEAIYPNYKTQVKTGGTIDQLIKDCTKFPQAAPGSIR